MLVALPAVASPPASPTQTAIHRISGGDTLTSIARRYNTSVAALKSLNNLRSDKIVAGRALQLTSGARALQRVTLSPSEREALAKLIHAEAQGEPFKGQVAVAAVVFNRIRDSRFPNTLRGVMYQPFQFEPILNGWAYKPAGSNAYRALDAALAGQDPTNGAVFSPRLICLLYNGAYKSRGDDANGRVRHGGSLCGYSAIGTAQGTSRACFNRWRSYCGTKLRARSFRAAWHRS